MRIKQIITSVVGLAVSLQATAAGFPFQPNTMLNAADLNSALQTAHITGGTADSLTLTNANISTSIGSFSSLFAPSVNLTGGLINGIPVGTTTPAAGAFTTISGSSLTVAGSASASSVSVTNGLTVGSVSVTNGLTASSVSVTNGLTASSVSVTNGLTASSVSVTNGLTASSVSVTNGLTASSVSVTNGLTVGAAIAAVSGVVSTGTYTGSFTDGVVIDYSSPIARLSVGPNDCIALYASGVAATQMDKFCTTGTQLQGTTTNDSAASGVVGEYISSTVASGSVSLTTLTPVNITSIPLTAGDWNVSGSIVFSPTGTTSITWYQASVSTTSATDGTLALNSNREFSAATAPGVNFSTITPIWHLQLSAPATVYLVADQAFTASTLTAGGTIHAWRLR